MKSIPILQPTAPTAATGVRVFAFPIRLKKLAQRLTALLLLGWLAPSAQPAVPSETLQLPMRDGTKLATDVYLPAGPPPHPVVLVRTTYNKDGLRALAEGAVQKGYGLVIQDTRGRFASEGENLPFDADGWAKHKDGLDTIEWIAKQPWCNGKIGTFGGSAVAITQYQLAGSGTGHLACRHLVVGTPNLYEGGIYSGGVFRKSLTEDWLKMARFSPQALEIWTSHPNYDAYWRERDASVRYRRINAPAVHVGGYFDIFAQGTIDGFVGYQTLGGPKARGRQKLLMGPWTHGVLTDQAGELTFPNARRPPNDVHDHWAWWEFHLKGQSNRFAALPAVTYYVMGDTSDTNAPGNVWRTAEAWPPLPTRSQSLYLHQDRTLSRAKPKRDGALTYRYDPADPVPTIGGYQLTIPSGPRDQRQIEQRQDVLVFTSDPLEEPLEVIGQPQVQLYASSDAPDTDFVVRLCDVYPDGRSFNICEGILRARHRKSLSQEHLLKSGKVYRLDIGLWSTSIIFNRGHRLRLHITSSSAPGYDPNPNTGEPFRHSEKIQVATQTIHLSAKHPTRLTLPVVAGP